MSEDFVMRDVIQMVLNAEAESKKILEEAQVEAERLTAEARRESQEIVQTARRGSIAEAETIVTQAEQEAEREKREKLAHATLDMERSVHPDEQAVQAAVEAV